MCGQVFKTYLPWRISERLSDAEGGGSPGGDRPRARLLRGRDGGDDGGCCADEAVPKEVLEKSNEYTHGFEEGIIKGLEEAASWHGSASWHGAASWHGFGEVVC